MEKLLRKAMEDYEEKKFVAKTENITLGMMLDRWIDEEVKQGTLSNGTVMSYQTVIRQIRKHPLQTVGDTTKIRKMQHFTNGFIRKEWRKHGLQDCNM